MAFFSEFVKTFQQYRNKNPCRNLHCLMSYNQFIKIEYN